MFSIFTHDIFTHDKKQMLSQSDKNERVPNNEELLAHSLLHVIDCL
jgi:hypothetical protein